MTKELQERGSGHRPRGAEAGDNRASLLELGAWELSLQPRFGPLLPALAVRNCSQGEGRGSARVIECADPLPPGRCCL